MPRVVCFSSEERRRNEELEPYATVDKAKRLKPRITTSDISHINRSYQNPHAEKINRRLIAQWLPLLFKHSALPSENTRTTKDNLHQSCRSRGRLESTITHTHTLSTHARTHTHTHTRTRARAHTHTHIDASTYKHGGTDVRMCVFVCVSCISIGGPS